MAFLLQHPVTHRVQHEESLENHFPLSITTLATHITGSVHSVHGNVLVGGMPDHAHIVLAQSGTLIWRPSGTRPNGAVIISVLLHQVESAVHGGFTVLVRKCSSRMRLDSLRISGSETSQHRFFRRSHVLQRHPADPAAALSALPSFGRDRTNVSGDLHANAALCREDEADDRIQDDAAVVRRSALRTFCERHLSLA